MVKDAYKEYNQERYLVSDPKHLLNPGFRYLIQSMVVAIGKQAVFLNFGFVIFSLQVSKYQSYVLLIARFTTSNQNINGNKD